MNRTQALFVALGWRGGTIHQVAAETGCEVADLIYWNSENAVTNRGAAYACGYRVSTSGNLQANNPKYRGNLNFWLGVADGIIELNLTK